jgi:hypothetical protein
MTAHVTSAGKSVLDELGLSAAYVVKAKLALRIQKSIAEMGLTQREAAALMPEVRFFAFNSTSDSARLPALQRCEDLIYDVGLHSDRVDLSADCSAAARALVGPPFPNFWCRCGCPSHLQSTG